MKLRTDSLSTTYQNKNFNLERGVSSTTPSRKFIHNYQLQLEIKEDLFEFQQFIIENM